MLFRAIVLALVLPAAFAYWITDRPAPTPRPLDSTSASMRGSSGQPQPVVPAPASRTEAFAFNPANPFGPTTGSPTSPPTKAQAASQLQRKGVPPAVAPENDPANAN